MGRVLFDQEMCWLVRRPRGEGGGGEGGRKGGEQQSIVISHFPYVGRKNRRKIAVVLNEFTAVLRPMKSRRLHLHLGSVGAGKSCRCRRARCTAAFVSGEHFNEWCLQQKKRVRASLFRSQKHGTFAFLRHRAGRHYYIPVTETGRDRQTHQGQLLCMYRKYDRAVRTSQQQQYSRSHPPL